LTAPNEPASANAIDLSGKVAVVTGAAAGLGRAEASGLARAGATVVVNDIAAALNACDVIDEITSAGSKAVAVAGDISQRDTADELISTADGLGGLGIVVNNAGITRDRMLFNMSDEEWDAVIAVHLRGHFCTVRRAAGLWREQAKAGNPVDARVINTSSGAGLMGSVGQGNYSAAKAGIVGLTLVAAAEMSRYGVTVNAIAPAARTRMTEVAMPDMMKAPEKGFDAMAPDNVSPLVVWLGSAESRDVTGRVFEVEGGVVSVADGWQHGPRVDKGARWRPDELGPVVRDLLEKAPAPTPVYGAS